uniref:Uncharacterized protein MANES_14G101400 n=1 Tax=Rhizophora mucronata TaxID=61149 RepID=A0A2P2IQB9_RHIMU
MEATPARRRKLLEGGRVQVVNRRNPTSSPQPGPPSRKKPISVLQNSSSPSQDPDSPGQDPTRREHPTTSHPLFS